MDGESGTYVAKLVPVLRKELKPKERIQTHQFIEQATYLASQVTYRVAIDIMKRLWRQTDEDAMKLSTYDGRTESIGKSLSEAYIQKSESILSEYNIDQSGVVTKESSIPCAAKELSLPPVKDEPAVRKQIREYNRGRSTETKIKYGPQVENIEDSTERVCYVSIDDILVKSQKDNKNKDKTREHKFVSNTVIHIQHEGHSYVLTAEDQDKAMKCLLAFLLSNHLLEDKRLIFFSDGATSIRDDIQKYFSFREHTLILDWFHLEHKCNQLLSMGVKGSKAEREKIKKDLADILWAGNVEKAKKYLQSLDKENIKSQKQLDDLIGYLDRKSPNIACYALRESFGLRNSSNLVEKANDRIVAVRQKKKGCLGLS